jgi:hypothetical protein
MAKSLYKDESIELKCTDELTIFQLTQKCGEEVKVIVMDTFQAGRISSLINDEILHNITKE